MRNTPLRLIKKTYSQSIIASSGLILSTSGMRLHALVQRPYQKDHSYF